MSPTLKILVNAGLLSALFAMQSVTFSLGFSRLALFYGAALAALVFVNRSELGRLPRLEGRVSRALTIFAGSFILMHIIRESMDHSLLMGDMRRGIKLGLVEMATAGTLFVLAAVALRSGTMLHFLVTVVLAIGGFVGLNLFLELSGLMQGSIEQGFESRYEAGLLRWMPPLTKSNGLFSILNRYALALGLLYLVHFRKTMPWILKACLAAGVLLEIYAGILLEHRAAIIPIPIALVGYWLSTSKTRSLLPWAMLVTMIAAPVMIGFGWWGKAAETLIPETVINLAGDPSTVYTFSNREYIYQYGLEYMASPKMSLFGDGPVFRDSYPGLRVASFASLENVGQSTSVQTFGFHNGFFDLIIPYGPLLGALFIISLIVAIGALGRKSSLPTHSVRFGLVNLSVILSVNVLDGGFSDINMMFLTLIGAALAVALAEQESRQQMPGSPQWGQVPASHLLGMSLRAKNGKVMNSRPRLS